MIVDGCVRELVAMFWMSKRLCSGLVVLTGDRLGWVGFYGVILLVICGSKWLFLVWTRRICFLWW